MYIYIYTPYICVYVLLSFWGVKPKAFEVPKPPFNQSDGQLQIAVDLV